MPLQNGYTMGSLVPYCCSEHMLNYEKQFRKTAESNVSKNMEFLSVSTEGYLIDSVGDISLDSLIERHIVNENATDPSRLEKIVPEETLEKLAERYSEGERGLSVSLHEISEPYIDLVVRKYLDDIEDLSSDQHEREKATQRNSDVNNLEWESGDLLHATSVSALPKILAHGNIAGEFLDRSSEHGERKQDLIPLFVDNTRLTKFTKDGISKQFVTPPGSASARLPKNARVFLLYKRSNTEWESGKDISGSTHENDPSALHGLLFVGIPATEISAVVVNKKSSIPEIIEILKEAEESGLYIPGFLKNGEKFY